jgi:hypothetical protein
MSAIIYLLQVSACTAIFYGFYYFMLNRLTFFTINRYYLILTLVLSFVIPLLTIHLQQDNYPQVVRQVVYVNTLQNLPAYKITASPNLVVEQGVNWLQLIKIIYLIAVVVFFTHLIIMLFNFFIKIKRGRIDRIGRVNVLHGNKQLANGSFLNYIFLNDDELSADEMQQIIAHEMLHIKLLHSADRIVAKIIQIILWFNPFVYLYLGSIEENHEFEVDRKITLSTDKNNYAELLLHLSIAKQGMLYHSFSKVPLKKRITMLFNKPSANMKRVIYLGIIPLIVLSCAAFARLKNDDIKSKKQYSIVGGLEQLGKNPVVLIDNKPYPSTILYTISESCVGGSSIMKPAQAVKYYGATAKDGLVNIRTKNGKVAFMTPTEKQILIENTDKEDAVPVTRFYNRLTLKKYNGEKYSKIIMHPPGNTLSAKIGLKDKAAYLFDGKLYDENSIQKLSPITIAAIKGEYSVEGNRAYWPRLRQYTAVFTFSTKIESPQNTTIDNGVGNNGGQQLKATAGESYSEINGVELLGKNPLVIIDGKEYPADLLYKISESCIKRETVFPGDIGIKKYGSKAQDGYAKIDTKNGKIVYMTAIERENLAKEASIPKDQFYTRLHLKNENGGYYDKAIIRRLRGGEASEELSVDGKIGFIIDDHIYNEEEFKKLLPTIIPTLVPGAGVGNAADVNEHGVNTKGYDVIFILETKGSKVHPLENKNLFNRPKS